MIYTKLLKNFEKDIKYLESYEGTIVQNASNGLNACKSALTSMKTEVRICGFNNEKEEILFFKKIKKIPLMYHFFYSAVIRVEIRMPKSTTANKINYLNRALIKVDKRLSRFAHLIKYKHEDECALDEQYFTRKYQNYPIILDNKLAVKYEDPIFNTACDTIWAEMHFLEMFSDYIKRKIVEIEKGEIGEESMIKKNRLKWTRSKTALVEMIYGIHCSGAINNGDVEIKRVVTQFEKYFNVDLGDYYGAYIQLKSRKINRTKFIDEIRSNLIRKMEEQEGLTNGKEQLL